MDRYLLTKEGRLCLVGSLLTRDTPVAVAQDGASNADIDFHGDVGPISDDEPHEQYVTRFTHA